MKGDKYIFKTCLFEKKNVNRSHFFVDNNEKNGNEVLL